MFGAVSWAKKKNFWFCKEEITNGKLLVITVPASTDVLRRIQKTVLKLHASTRSSLAHTPVEIRYNSLRSFRLKMWKVLAVIRSAGRGNCCVSGFRTRSSNQIVTGLTTVFFEATGFCYREEAVEKHFLHAGMVLRKLFLVDQMLKQSYLTLTTTWWYWN